MYFIEAFYYPFKGQNWFGKFFIAFLLTVIPIVNIFGALLLAGYSIRIVREILAGRMELPEFDFGEDIFKGFLLVIAGIVYSIPFLLLSSQVQRVRTTRGISTSLTIEPVLAIVLVIIGILLSMFLLIATVRYAATDDFGVFIDFGGNFALLRSHIGSVLMYALNVILFGLAGMLVVMLGFVACILPGLIMAIGLVFGRSYLLAQFALDIGLSIDEYEEKAKGKPRSSSGSERPGYRY